MENGLDPIFLIEVFVVKTLPDFAVPYAEPIRNNIDLYLTTPNCYFLFLKQKNFTSRREYHCRCDSE